MQCREKKEIKTENKKTADLACWDNISIHALTSLIPDSTHSNYSLKMKTTTRSIHILAKRKNRKKKLKKWQGGNTEQKRWKKATLKNHKDVERSWMCCILSLYLFISVSCLGVTHPLKLSAAPNWNQISGRPWGSGCFFGSSRKDWIKTGEISWFWGFLGGKKNIRVGCFFLWGPKVDWQRVSFRVSILQSVRVQWTNAAKKIFSEVELLYWPINTQGFNLQISKYSISVLLFGVSV